MHHPSLTDRSCTAPDAPQNPTGVESMAHRLMTPGGKTLYALRKQMPEPVCGIIKSVLGFRQFLLRGLDCVRGEWRLVTSAWNLKRRFALCPSAGGEKGYRVQINGRDEPFVVELRVLSRCMAAQPQHSEPAARPKRTASRP